MHVEVQNEPMAVAVGSQAAAQQEDVLLHQRWRHPGFLTPPNVSAHGCATANGLRPLSRELLLTHKKHLRQLLLNFWVVTKGGDVHESRPLSGQ